jgi:hypothetical protein
MTLAFDQVNWLAVLVAGVAAFLLGGVWYTALFGKQRVQLLGYSEAKLKEMQAKCPPPVFFGTMFVCYLVVALVVALVAHGAQVTSATGGMLLGFLLWLGPAAAIGLTGHIACDHRCGVYVIDASFQLVFLVMMGAIIGGWR